MRREERKPGIDEERLRRAAEWIAEHESGSTSDPAQLPGWVEWCADPENRLAYAKLIEILNDFAELPSPPMPSDEELSGSNRSRVRMGLTRIRQVFATGPIRSLRPLPWVAVVALVLIATTVVLTRAYAPWNILAMQPRAYLTHPGEQKEFKLTDGSKVTLGGDTAIAVRFSARTRIVVLKHGEILCRVEHNPQRPFVVEAGTGMVTAVGTIFDVRLYQDQVRVWVKEGVVEIAPLESITVDGKLVRSDFHWLPARIIEGQERSYTRQGRVSSVGADPNAGDEWTRGELVYRGRPLAEIVQDVERYSGFKITVDPQSAALEYSGTIVQSHIDDWLQRLPEIFPVEVIADGSGHVVIRHR